MQDGSERSRLLQLFLRKDTFEDEKYPELSRAVKYFKTPEEIAAFTGISLEEVAEVEAFVSAAV